MLKLSENGAIEINVFLSRANASVTPRVNVDAQCEYIFTDSVAVFVRGTFDHLAAFNPYKR